MHILPSTLAAARILSVLALAILTTTACQQTSSTPATPAAAPAPPSTLEADVAHLKDITPAQSHTMIDVGYHMSNLWFAAQHKNWDLAAFEVDETRNRIRWTIRISPTRKKPDGEIVDIKGIFDGVDTGAIAPLRATIEKKDSVQFVAAYRVMLESCYACHKSIGRPYLRPQIPTATTQPIINVDPAAAWPQ